MATWKMINEDYPTDNLLGWHDLKSINQCTFDSDDEYVAYYDADEPIVENREYAVYTKNEGNLFCLLRHAGIVFNLWMDDATNRKAYELYRKAAIDAGFPEHIKHYMTWREVRDKLNELDDEHLDMTAWVWCHGESIDGEIGITGISCYYTYTDLNEADEDNHISLSIDD